MMSPNTSQSQREREREEVQRETEREREREEKQVSANPSAQISGRARWGRSGLGLCNREVVINGLWHRGFSFKFYKD